MKTSNPIFFRQLIPDLIKHKKSVIRFILICICFFVVIGYYHLDSAQSVNAEKQEEIDTYNEQLASYDNTLEEVQTSLDLVDEQIQELQEYIDNSIYMKLDSQNIHIFNVQYTATTEANVGNILNALTIFVNDGGIQEGVIETNPELEPNYWREVLSCGISGNNFNIVLMHYDEEKGNEIIKLIKERIQAQIPNIAAAQGAFTLTEINSSHYLKADSNVTNTQNNHRNNLKNYTSNRVDFENKLITQENNRKKLIENSKPEELTLQSVNPITFMLKYVFVGALFGIVIPCAFFLIRYTLGNRIHSAEDLKAQGMEILGTISQNDANVEKFTDAAALSKALLDKNNYKVPYVRLISSEESGAQELQNYAKSLNENGFNVLMDSTVDSEASKCIEKLAESDSCILVIVQNESTYPQLESFISLCKTLQIPIIGSVFII